MLQTIGSLHEVSVPRAVYPSGTPKTQQLFAFSDEVAIACVVYLRTGTTDDQMYVAFVLGNSRLTPKGATVKGQ